jgi:hypothetical protein
MRLRNWQPGGPRKGSLESPDEGGFPLNVLSLRMTGLNQVSFRRLDAERSALTPHCNYRAKLSVGFLLSFKARR